MFDSVLELASQAASNSLFIFCFCNLIIAIIFVVSKPPNGRGVSLPKVTYKNTIDEEATKVEDTTDAAVQDQQKKATELMEDITESENHNHSNIVIVDEGCNHEDEGDDDELNARIEDFIAKVNREWEAEKLKANTGVPSTR